MEKLSISKRLPRLTLSVLRAQSCQLKKNNYYTSFQNTEFLLDDKPALILNETPFSICLPKNTELGK